MNRLSAASLGLLSLAVGACTSLPEVKQHWYEFPKDAYRDEGIRPHQAIGSVRARTEFPSLDPDNDFEKLCRNYYNKTVAELVKSAKAQGADAVIEVKSVVFLETGEKETYKTPECADDGEEGQSLTEGLAVKWVSAESLAAKEPEPARTPVVIVAAPPVPASATAPPRASAPVKSVAPTMAAKAAELLRAQEQAYRGTTDDTKRFALLDSMAHYAYDAGDSAKARDYADRLLKSAPAHKGQWSYGNAIHHGNLVLGRLALRAGDVLKAKTYLLLAGQTPGSPQLDSFGPNMSLAGELLARGERQVVLDYLDLCSKFWRDDFARKQIADWKGEIQAGRAPDFWAHLHD